MSFWKRSPSTSTHVIPKALAVAEVNPYPRHDRFTPHITQTQRQEQTRTKPLTPRSLTVFVKPCTYGTNRLKNWLRTPE